MDNGPTLNWLAWHGFEDGDTYTHEQMVEIVSTMVQFELVFSCFDVIFL